MGRTEKGFDLIPRSPQLGKIKTCYISYGTEFVEQKNKGKKKGVIHIRRSDAGHLTEERGPSASLAG
jgi:hypothetical protein